MLSLSNLCTSGLWPGEQGRFMILWQVFLHHICSRQSNTHSLLSNPALSHFSISFEPWINIPFFSLMWLMLCILLLISLCMLLPLNNCLFNLCTAKREMNGFLYKALSEVYYCVTIQSQKLFIFRYMYSSLFLVLLPWSSWRFPQAFPAFKGLSMGGTCLILVTAIRQACIENKVWFHP